LLFIKRKNEPNFVKIGSYHAEPAVLAAESALKIEINYKVLF
jgi:hypothetical protein